MQNNQYTVTLENVGKNGTETLWKVTCSKYEDSIVSGIDRSLRDVLRDLDVHEPHILRLLEMSKKIGLNEWHTLTFTSEGPHKNNQDNVQAAHMNVNNSNRNDDQDMAEASEGNNNTAALRASTSDLRASSNDLRASSNDLRVSTSDLRTNDMIKEAEIIVEIYPSENFDLYEYASRYTGHTKIRRLLFIAARCPVYKLDALQLAIEEIKNGTSTSIYRKTFEKESKYLSECGISFDHSWVDSTDRRAQTQSENLEIELQNHRQNLDKVKIRESHLAMGKFYFSRGDYGGAIRSFIRTQDYCTAPEHILDLCLNAIEASIEMDNFAHVMNYLPKAEAAVSPDNVKHVANLSAISGLSFFENPEIQKCC
jgi:COP9 signalosome complex subunit 1